MRHVLIRAGALVLALNVGSAACADDGAQGTVTGQGSVELRRQAEILRVRVQVLAKGKSLKEALSKLRERKLSAQKNLEALGMSAKSLEFGEPTIVDEKNDRQNQMAMRMMMRQMRNQGNKPAQKPKEAPPVTVAAMLKAEFRLQAAEPDDFLLAANALEERLKAADLGGLKQLKQASGQDEEMAQEDAQEMMGVYDANAPKKGEPLFYYVSKIPEDEQEKARAQAYKKAKQEATKLAQAAGVELGALHSLTDNASAAGAFETEAMMRMNSMRVYAEQMQEEEGNEESRPGEAFGLKPKKVVYRIVVSASFQLKKPGQK